MPTLSEIRGQVRWESRNEASAIPDARIDNLLWLSFRSVTSKYKFLELRTVEPLVLTSSGVIVLPSNQHFDELQYALTSSNQDWYDLTPYNPYSPSAYYGVPQWYLRKAGTATLYPNSDINTASHSIQFNYYRYPVELSVDAQELEIPYIEDYLVLKTTSRIMVFENSDAATALNQMANTELNTILSRQGFVNG